MGQTRSASPPTSKFQLRLPDADTPAMETNARNSRTQAKPCGQVKKRALNSPVSTTPQTTTRCCAGLPNTHARTHTDRRGFEWITGFFAFVLLVLRSRSHPHFPASAPINECCTRLENRACVCGVQRCVWAQVAISRLPASILPLSAINAECKLQIIS